jgi:hypothetical protein
MRTVALTVVAAVRAAGSSPCSRPPATRRRPAAAAAAERSTRAAPTAALPSTTHITSHHITMPHTHTDTDTHTRTHTHTHTHTHTTPSDTGRVATHRQDTVSETLDPAHTQSTKRDAAMKRGSAGSALVAQPRTAAAACCRVAPETLARTVEPRRTPPPARCFYQGASLPTKSPLIFMHSPRAHEE